MTSRTGTGPVDIVCLGETMVQLRPARPGGLSEAAVFARDIGGAESNVACALARSGHSARWVSRVGADGFGDLVLRTVADAGVDTSLVDRDPDRPTGVYFRTDGERGVDLEVAYYRAGSAASAMSPATVDRTAADSGRILHLSGITPALSVGCLELTRDLLAPRPDRPLISFDVNYRPALWRDRVDSALLLDLARTSDVALVGEDEAEAAWGVTGGPEAVRAALPEPAVLVVKQGAQGATAFLRAGEQGGDRAVHAPAPLVDVVAPVGAGDAFAAGFLSGTLRGLPLFDRLRHGHLMAAAALTVSGDLAEGLTQAQADRLVALDPQPWGRLRLSPGWITQEAMAP